MARRILFLAIVYCHCATSFALDPHRRISQYEHTAWRAQDGAPVGATITQTSDGYVWLGTREGLFRFDGIRFVHFAPKGLDIPSGTFSSLLGSRDGSLWMGTAASLFRLKDGRLQQYGDPNQRIGYATIIEDRAGTIWVTRYHIPSGNQPLCRVEGDKLHCFGEADGIPPVRYGFGLTQDDVGNLWFGSSVLCRWRPGTQGTTYMDDIPALKNSGSGVIDVAAVPGGTIWATVDGIGPRMGVRYFSGDKWAPYIVSGFNGTKVRSHTLFVDKNHSLWVGTEHEGIYRIHDGISDHYGTADGLSGNAIVYFYEDHEGDLWVMTDGGVDKFRDTSVVTYSMREGLSASDLSAILALRDGSIWIGNEGGIDIIRGEQHKHFSAEKELPGQDVTSLFQDHSGAVWVGLFEELLRYEAGRFHKVKPSLGSRLDGSVVSITEDTDQNIWVLNSKHHLFRIKDGTAQEVLEVSSDSRATGYMAPDREGGIWVAAANGALTHYHSGIVETTMLKGREGDSLIINDIMVDTDDTLLVSANKGFFAWNKDRWIVLDSKNGLPCDDIFTALKDNNGALWLSSRCGYVKLPPTEVEHWRQGNDGQLRVEILDRFDGARVRSSSIASQPLSTKAPDGTLWFTQNVAAQMIDPNHIYANGIAPPVQIEGLVADHGDYEVGKEIRLPASTRDVEINYTALSMAVPQKVLFRYRLEGRDNEWQDAETRRQAFYTNLPPGKYRFLVTARNNSGVWNEAGASLEFYIVPAFYQRAWFLVLCIGLLLLLLLALYQLRFRQLQRQFAIGLEARVNERLRIARELHDTLLQSFQGLMLRFQSASDLLPARAQDAKQRLDIAIDYAAKAITEGRDAVHQLRSTTVVTNDLASDISMLASELGLDNNHGHPPEFSMQVEGRPQNLHPIVRDEVYRIAAEALRNAFKHSGAQRIEVEIRYGERELRMRTRDDGRGIDPTVPAQDRPEGHWGLSGMRERAKLLGGNLEVWSESDSGTEIELIIPASFAYTERKAWYRRLLAVRKGA